MNLNSYERLDDLQCQGYKIIQDLRGFCFGVDAVALANFTRVKPNEQALDLGTGSGIIPILLAAKTKGAHFYGVDIQAESVEMARRSVALNSLEDKVTICQGDVKYLEFSPATFHVVTCNPPYIKNGSGLVNPYSPKAIARHEISANLRDFISAAASMLMPKGRFYIVHKPHRLAEIINILHQFKLEPKILQFVHSSPDKPPSMLLLEAIKGGNPDIMVLQPLVLD